MSRHDLQPKADQPHVVRATVGWDRPLQTFFAQVFFRTEDEPDEGEALIWLGTEPGEMLTPEAVIAVVAPHVEMPPDLAERLDAENASDDRHERRPPSSRGQAVAVRLDPLIR